MENVSLKLDSDFVREIGKAMKFAHYSTKTEFIRDSIRDKLAKVKEERAKEKAWEKLFSMRGTLKGQAISDKEFYKKRKAYGERLAKEIEKEIGLKTSRLLPEKHIQQF